MFKYVSLFFLLFISITVEAKLSSNDLDKLYNQVAMGQVSSIDFNKSIEEISATIANKTSSIEDKLKSHLILGFLYRIQGNTKASIEIAEQGENLAAQEKEYLWQARLNGFISTSYRQKNQLTLSKERLMYAIDISKKAPKNIGLIWFNLNANKELAYHASFDNNISEAVRFTEESSKWAKKLNDAGSSYLIAVNYHYLGVLYSRSKQADLAILNYQKALDLVSNAKDTVKSPLLKNQILVDLGEEYMKKEEFPKAYGYFKSVMDDYNGSKPYSLMKDLYSNLTNYYLHTNNLDSLTLYKGKLDSLNRSVVKLDPDFSNNFAITGVLLNKIEEENQLSSYIKYRNYVVGAFIGLSALAFLVYYRKKSKGAKEILDIGDIDSNNYSKEVKEPKTRTNTKDRINTSLIREDKKKEVKIAKSTTERLTVLFKEFEASKQFIDPGVNVGLLANRFNTNNKYIAYTLKSMYNKDFAAYINDLRVNYIIELLENEPKYREYKISYLADLCGFSSHSKFATNFKKIKGVSPSEFIESLQEKGDTY